MTYTLFPTLNNLYQDVSEPLPQQCHECSRQDIELITCHLYPSVLLLSRVWYFIEMVVKSVRWSRNDCVEVGGPGGRWSLYCILQQLEQLIMIRTGMAVVKVACPD